jgi:hypothetical protein
VFTSNPLIRATVGRGSSKVCACGLLTLINQARRGCCCDLRNMRPVTVVRAYGGPRQCGLRAGRSQRRGVRAAAAPLPAQHPPAAAEAFARLAGQAGVDVAAVALSDAAAGPSGRGLLAARDAPRGSILLAVPRCGGARSTPRGGRALQEPPLSQLWSPARGNRACPILGPACTGPHGMGAHPSPSPPPAVRAPPPKPPAPPASLWTMAARTA